MSPYKRACILWALKNLRFTPTPEVQLYLVNPQKRLEMF